MWVDLFCKALKLPALVLYVFILVIKRLHFSAHRLLPRVLEKPSAPLCCGIECSQLSGLTFLLFLTPRVDFFSACESFWWLNIVFKVLGFLCVWLKFTVLCLLLGFLFFMGVFES